MKTIDLEKERSEMELSPEEFLASYNEGLPSSFPRLTPSLLKEFRENFPKLFKRKDVWTLGQHRKKVMEWLPRRVQDLS